LRNRQAQGLRCLEIHDQTDAGHYCGLLRPSGKRGPDHAEGDDDSGSSEYEPHPGFHGLVLWSRDNLEPPDPRRPIPREIPAIYREDPANDFALGDPHKGGISEVHGEILVLVHQLPHSWDIGCIDRNQPEGFRRDQVPQGILGLPRKAQQVHGLTENWPGRTDGFSQGAQGRDTTLMVSIASMEQRNQGTSINQNHGVPRAISSLEGLSPVRSERSAGPPQAQPMTCEKAS
jgi:hypothetical protein